MTLSYAWALGGLGLAFLSTFHGLENEAPRRSWQDGFVYTISRPYTSDALELLEQLEGHVSARLLQTTTDS